MLTHILTVLLVLLARADAVSAGGGVQKHFVITAYYSPLPGQCCYVTGSEEGDRTLNGHGTHGADGTPVYAGMAAAPASYAFNTRIALPGIGTVTVHDRGGAIVEQGQSDRLDLWMGSGEEGLARAMAFGVRRVTGTVYPPGTAQPEERFALEEFAAPPEEISPYAVGNLLHVAAALGDRTWSVRTLQSALAVAGVFDHPATGFFGAVTQEGLRAFIARYGLRAPDDRLTPEVAAYLLAEDAAGERSLPIGHIDRRASKEDIRYVQRLLRGFGLYDGRTDGRYSQALQDAIVRLQQEAKLVADASSPGAGRIGPKTLAVLERRWKNAVVRRAAEALIVRRTVEERLAAAERLVSRPLAKGSKGKDVSLLQRFLAEKGYFDIASMNGYYGDQTAAAVEAFQRDRGIVTLLSRKGAGTVGPATLQRIRTETVQVAAKRVAAQGWSAL